MVNEGFRRQLRHEADIWRNEGLIDEEIYQQLSDRYQFQGIDLASRNRFVMILIGLGSILIGLGVITFVAANWQELSKLAKVMLLLILLLGFNLGGFYFWRSPNTNRLGHGLLILGALSLGASIGLMGQIFHIKGEFYQLLLVWGMGVLVMSYSLRLTSLGILSIILLGLGYFNGLHELFLENNASIYVVILQHFSLVGLLLFVPLAYVCKSRIIFGFSSIITLVAWSLYPILASGTVLGLALAFMTPIALLWAIDDSYLIDRFNMTSFRSLSRAIAVWWLSIILYLESSYWFWNEFRSDYEQLSSLVTFELFIFGGMAIAFWVLLMRSRKSQEEHLNNLAMLVFIIISGLVPLVYHQNPDPILATFLFNILLFLLAGGLIRSGLSLGYRLYFWGGMMLLTIRIMSWFFLSNTELIIKALLFILSGIAIIGIGLWFEKYVKTLVPSNKEV